MNKFIALYDLHGTKILGYAQAILAGWLLIPGLFHPDNLKWAQAIGVVLGVLTVRRGYENSARGDDGSNSGV
jgi:hypothetical protein